MAMRRYLAMTQGEFHDLSGGPWRPAWMACHFSPYDSGITNLPGQLPKGSLLILNDRIPPMNIDPAKIFSGLEQIILTKSCSGLLLDFQRPECSLLNAVIDQLLTLPCPVALTVPYAKEYSCPVLLPPVPLTTPIVEYLSPWKDREVWLELALSECRITVDRQRCRRESCDTHADLPFYEENLFCHYRHKAKDNCAVFHLRRTKDDLENLLNQAESLGVTTAVGLWQELK